MASYRHTILQLKCSINSTSEKSVKIRLPSHNNWTKNLESILVRIPKRFKFLQNINESEWVLSINGTIISKQEPRHFGQLLSMVPPLATVQIIECPDKNMQQLNIESKENKYMQIDSLSINYEASSMVWTPLHPYRDNDKYWNDNYNNLINEISKKFNIIPTEFQLEDNDQCIIYDGYDLNLICMSSKTDEKQRIGLNVILNHVTDIEHSLGQLDDVNKETELIIESMKADEILALRRAIDENTQPHKHISAAFFKKQGKNQNTDDKHHDEKK
eukprot:497085_1